MQSFGPCEPLDRFHLAASDFAYRRQAGSNGPPVEQDRASAALAFVIAPLLRPRQSEFVAQDIEQRPRRIDVDRNRGAIHLEGNKAQLVPLALSRT